MKPHQIPKLHDLNALTRCSARLRAEGKKLVLTNGCFDLLHVGHVRYLQQARNLGDALAVAINDDASVRRLKGPGRPINSARDRAEILGAMEVVDIVTVFSEDTAEEVVRAVQPSIYVKGGDYSDNPEEAKFPPEGVIVRAYGGEVHVLPYVPGRSTTEMLRRIGG